MQTNEITNNTTDYVCLYRSLLDVMKCNRFTKTDIAIYQYLLIIGLYDKDTQGNNDNRTYTVETTLRKIETEINQYYAEKTSKKEIEGALRRLEAAGLIQKSVRTGTNFKAARTVITVYENPEGKMMKGRNANADE